MTTSGLTEDVIVLTKLAVLAGIAATGIGMFSPSRLGPLDNEGLLGVFLGAAVIFVAYEGFELVPYDYDDILEPRRTLPRALYLRCRPSTGSAEVDAVEDLLRVAADVLRGERRPRALALAQARSSRY